MSKLSSGAGRMGMNEESAGQRSRSRETEQGLEDINEKDDNRGDRKRWGRLRLGR